MPSPQNPGDTCWTILRAASSGNAEARAAFSHSYAATIRGFLNGRWRGRVLATEADDATQEVFLECFKPGGVLERARTLVEEAGSDQLWAILDTLALAQHRTGDSAGAIETQKQAIALMPAGTDPEMPARLAEYEADLKDG